MVPQPLEPVRRPAMPRALWPVVVPQGPLSAARADGL
jgi:hypothetical protein